MRFEAVVQASARVADTSSRKEKTEHLAACLRGLVGDEIVVGVAYLMGELRQGRVGLGYAAVYGSEPGGATDAAALDLLEVDRAFDAIATISGPGSKSAKQRALEGLLARATPDEQHFLKRLVVGELRQGALEGVLVEAVAKAADLPAADVRRAAMLGGDLKDVAAAALLEGASGLARFRMQLLRPIQPMLASSAGDAEEALAKLGVAAFEWKLDGARIQVHKDGGEVRVFSRRQNDVSRAVPEVVELVRGLPAKSLLLDGEVLALRADGRPRPFQETMRRFGRKLDVGALRAELPLTPFFFDLLHVDGDDVLDRAYDERWAALAGALPEDARVPRLVAEDAEEAEAFFASALERGHEGVVAKGLDAPYEAGRRGAKWIKVKPAHTLDLVVLAAEWGSGRRRGWLSNLHLGARDPKSGGFVMLGKTFKGMTDAVLEWQTKKLQELELARDDYTVHVRPELVVEIAFDGVQASPHYPGGVALRFARLKRYRDDKQAADADTIEAVRSLGGFEG